MDLKPSDRSAHLKQYKNQSSECHATHQAKYGTPGVFPVVHLAKKNLPVLSITPNEISMHLNVDEPPLYYESKYCDVGIADETPDCEISYDNQAASVNSHNLLDALKEISRKRIHSENEDLHTPNLKQARCSPISNSVPIVTNSATIPEIQPVTNPINASLSSARTFITYPRKGILKKKLYLSSQKTVQKHVLTQTDYQLEKKLQPNRIFINNIQHKKSPEAKDICNDSTSPSSAVFMPKVFDRTQFELAKKNRLATLLAALTGSKAEILAYKSEPDKATPDTEESSTQNKITSILSPRNKPKHDKHVTFAIPDKEKVKETSNEIIVEADLSKNMVSPFQVPNNVVKDPKPPQDHIVAEPPPIVVSSPEPKTPFVIPKFTNIEPLVTQASTPTTINSSPSKVGGFKFDFKSTEPVNTPIVQPSKPQYSFTNPNSLGANMFGTTTSASFPANTNSFFNNETVVKPKSTIDPLHVSLNTRSSSGLQFGTNTTVTSIGKTTLLSTGLGSSAIGTTSATFGTSSSPKLNFDANQTFSPTTTFGIKPIISSTPNPISSPSVFGTSVFTSTQNFNTNPLPTSNFNVNPLPTSNFNSNPTPTSNFNSNLLPNSSFNANPLPTTNFNVNSSSAGGLPAVTNMFGSAVPINKPKPVESLPTPSTTPFNFSSPIFSNNQFKSDSPSTTTGFGDKTTTKSNIFNNAPISTQNNIFGAPSSNSMAGNFTGFNATTPTSMYSLFPTSTTSTTQPQSESFTKNSSEVFSFGNPTPNAGKFVVDTNNLFSSVPTSAFGSAVTSTLQPTTNSFTYSPSVGFNAYNNTIPPPNDPTGSRIFNIGSGSTYQYPKSRAQLKGRRRT